MPVVLDTNMKLFAERMNITSSRMIQDYGLKTVEEIIEAEAEKGNMQAVNYAAEVFHSPAKLIQVFRLADVENRFVILHKMDDATREQVLPLLDQQDLVMGLYFFTQEKLLEMLEKEIAPRGIGKWSSPKGGYFISFHALNGCAKEIVRLAKEAGVVLTPAGAPFPYGIDPEDKNIRIAPSYPSTPELYQSMNV